MPFDATNQQWSGTLSHLSHLMGRVRAQLRSVGLEIKAGSRLHTFGQYLDGLLADSRTGTTSQLALPNLGALIEGLRDAEEIAVIVEHLLPTERLSVTGKLQEVLGGGTYPSQDRNAVARNLQYELYIAALLKFSGLRVYLEEPDLVCYVDGVEIGIAAKRVASEDRMEKLVREGGRQLRKAGKRGIVAVSLDRIVSSRNPQVWASSDRLHSNVAEKQLAQLVEANLPLFDRALAGTPGHGILATLVFPTVLSAERPEQPRIRVTAIGKVCVLYILDAGDVTTPKRVQALTTLRRRLVFPDTFQ